MPYQERLQLLLKDYLKDSSTREQSILKLKRCLESTHITLEKWEPLLPVEQNEEDFQENEQAYYKELVLEVSCSVLLPSSYNTQRFVSKWLKATQAHYFKDNKPWLEFKTGKAFNSRRKNTHEGISFANFGHGTLSSPSSFIQHQVERCYSANFYHDEMIFEIMTGLYKRSRLRSYPYKLETNYRNIHTILVSDKSLIVKLHSPMLMYQGMKRIVSIGSNTPELLGKSNSIFLDFADREIAHEIVARFWHRCHRMGLSINFVDFTREKKCPNQIPTPQSLLRTIPDFNCLFLTDAILRRTFALELQNFPSFVSHVCRNLNYSHKATEKALTDMVYLCDRGDHFYFLEMFEHFYNLYRKLEKEGNTMEYLVPSNCLLIRKAIITPNRVLLFPQEICMKNRVVRAFDVDYALRITFRDEDYKKLNAHSSFDDIVIKNTVMTLLFGIQIGDRKFEFLAWSNSQIRDHGVWAYARNSEGTTAAEIRDWMGDFSSIKCVPKYLSRMGQCFSQTQDAGKVSIRESEIVCDIQRGFDPESGKPYCFSDGIGRISKKLANEVLTKLGHNKQRSAFQIRYKGNKGMLVMDPKLKHTSISFRKSMVKFECSSSETLEICKVSKAIPVALNRPVITILDQQGIKHGVFLRIQEDALQNLTEMFFDDKKAAHYLRSHQNLSGVNFEELVNCGISLTTEPFFRSMLMRGHFSDIDDILRRARLFLDPSKGRNMFGVLDETGYLQYGEVFVQYTTNLLGEETNEQTTILNGDVLVGKNPCHQLGDIRKFKAVDVPQLHHIVDCIVFPQNGHRPHPNELSGSDLDGDEYTVIWNKDLMFRGNNHEPRHFPVPKNELVHGTIQVNQMLDFLCTYISSDNIGMLSTAHLAVADRSGLTAHLCETLARKCSIAVDFAKNGEKVRLETDENPPEFPDFMQKHYQYNYHSKRALGKMFRVCKDFCDIGISTSQSYQNVQHDMMMEYPGCTQYQESAQKSLANYNSALERILTTYGISHESQAMSGCYGKLHGRYNMTKDKAEIVELVALSVKELWRKTKESFLEEFQDISDLDELESKVLAKASAWYNVTYRSHYRPKYLSFPWVVSSHLSQVKFINISKLLAQPSRNPVLEKLEELAHTFERTLPRLSPHVEMTLQVDVKVTNRLVRLKDMTLALQLLIKFVAHTGVNYDDRTLRRANEQLDPHTILQILMVVAERESKTSHLKYGAISLVLAFLKFCMALRFLDKKDRKLEFYVPRLSVLSKKAMACYRHIALTHGLENFGLRQSSLYYEELDVVELHPPKILPKKWCQSLPSMDTLKQCLVEWSGVEDITLREKYNTWVVSATGAEKGINILKVVFAKSLESLKKAVTTGQAPF